MIKQIETHGFTMDMRVWTNAAEWERYLYGKFGNAIKELRLYAWHSKTFFADCVLKNKHYGQFTVTSQWVHFNGHTASKEEVKVFEEATWNDDCFDGMLFKSDSETTGK